MTYYEDALSITKNTHKGNKEIDLVSLNQTFDHIELLDIIFINQQKIRCGRDKKVTHQMSINKSPDHEPPAKLSFKTVHVITAPTITLSKANMITMIY